MRPRLESRAPARSAMRPRTAEDGHDQIRPQPRTCRHARQLEITPSAAPATGIAPRLGDVPRSLARRTPADARERCAAAKLFAPPSPACEAQNLLPPRSPAA